MEKELIRYETGEKNGWTVWSLSGRLSKITSEEAGVEADKIFARSAKFAIDMSGLEYLSSAGIRVLLRLTKKAKAERKEFALCAPAGIVRTVLTESRMDMFVTIYPSTDELK